MTISSVLPNIKPTISHVLEETKNKGQLVTGQIAENLKQATGFAQTHFKTACTVATAVIAGSIFLGHVLADGIEEEGNARSYIKGSLAFGAVILTSNLILKYVINFPASKLAIATIVATSMAVHSFFTFVKISETDQQEIKNLKKQIAEAQKQNIEFKEKFFNPLTNLARKKEQKIADLENQLKLVNNGEKEALVLQIADLTKQLKTNNDQLLAKNKAFDELEKELKDAQTQLANLKETNLQELADKQNKVEELQAQLDTKQTEIGELQKRVVELENSVVLNM